MICNFFREARHQRHRDSTSPRRSVLFVSTLNVDSCEPVIRLRLETHTRESTKMRVYAVIDRCMTSLELNEAKDNRAAINADANLIRTLPSPSLSFPLPPINYELYPRAICIVRSNHRTIYIRGELYLHSNLT